MEISEFVVKYLGDVSRKKRKKVIDQMAAVQILQSFLDRQNGGF